jgi:hypothetical protein
LVHQSQKSSDHPRATLRQMIAPMIATLLRPEINHPWWQSRQS